MDCLNQDGINTLMLLLPAKNRMSFSEWIRGASDPPDEQSKKKAYELYSNSIPENTEIGTIKGLQQIHAYLFEGLYDFAGKIRKKIFQKMDLPLQTVSFLIIYLRKSMRCRKKLLMRS